MDRLELNHQEGKSPEEHSGNFLRIGIPRKGMAARQISGVARRGGIVLYADGRSRRWAVTGTTFPEEGIVLQGDTPTGTPLSVLLPANPAPPPRAPLWLSHLVGAAVHATGDAQWCVASISTVTAREDGGILFLDRELAHHIAANLPADRRSAEVEPYMGIPSADGPRAVVRFTIAVAYHQLTGHLPLKDSRGEPVPPVHLHAPQVEPSIAALIDAVLAEDRQATPEVLEELWKNVSRGWMDTGDPHTVEERRNTAAAHHERRVKDARRRLFLRRYGGRIAVATAAILLVLSVPVSILRTRMAPPRTVDMTPYEVVRAFYHGWRALDHELMTDAAASGAVREHIREVTNIFVIDRVRTAHEMRSVLITPDEWYALDSPADRIPYGPAGLHIESLGATDTEHHFRVTYVMYRPGEDMEVWRTESEDHVVVGPGRRSWEIQDISSSP